MSRFSYKTLLIILLFLLIPIVILLRLNQKPPTALAGWWNDTWSYRQAITVTVSSGTSDVANLDTMLSIGTSALIASGKLQSNCADLRFTSATGKVLPYYIDSGCNTSATKVWVRADLVPKNTTTYTIYLYYGNPSAATTSNSTTFNLYNGLVGYWNFNENTGTTATDSSVNNLTGTLENTPTWGIGKYGIGLTFNGSNQRVNIGNSSAIQISNGTIGAWINTSNAGSGWRGIIAKQSAYGMFLNDNIFSIYDWGSATTISTGSTLNDNTWHHLTVTFQSGVQNGTNMYIDGQLSKTTSMTVSNQSIKLYIAEANANQYFTGIIDDVRIYNRALSPTEVSQLYSNPGSITGSTSSISKPSAAFAAEEVGGGPVAWWKFDEGVGTTAYDSSGHSNSGAFGAGTSAPTWVDESQCISGKCLKFDGSNDYVNLGGTLTTGGNRTLEAWIRLNTTGAAQTIFSNNAASSYPQWYVRASTNKMMLHNGTTYIESSTALNAQTWYHVAVTIDNSNAITYYLNGKPDGTGTLAVQTFSGSTDLGKSVGYTDYLNGFLDDVKIYPYARTATQIKQDYATGLTGMSTAKGANTNIGSNSQKSLSDGLVGYWKFDEGVGTTVADSSGNNNLATSGAGTSSPTWTAGKYGSALDFDYSQNQYVSVTDNSSISPQYVTVSAWIKARSYTPMYGRIFSKTGSFDLQLYGTGVSPGNLEFDIRIPAESDTVTSGNGTTIPLNVWTQVAVTFDGQKSVIYINGVQKSIHSYSGTITDTSNPFNIDNTSGGNGNFDGQIDEVRLYNRALNPTEVKALYNYAPGPVGYWKFDEGVGTTAYDNSGNSNNGALGAGNSSPTWTIGKIGKALNFDGSNDYINASNNTALNPNQITATAWVKWDGTANEQEILGRWGSGGTSTTAYVVGVNSGGKLFTKILNSTPTEVGVTDSVTFSTTWTHVAVTYDGSNIRLYKNGIQVNSGSQTGNINSVAAPLYIGGITYSSLLPWDGLIDDVKIYNYARTQEQILQDMAGSSSLAGAGAKAGPPLAYYKFDEGQGLTANNTGIGGTALNATLGSGSSAPTWTNGNNGKALNFNGSVNYVQVPNPSISSGSFTISGWFKPARDESDGYGTLTGYDGSHRLLLNTNGTLLVQFGGNFFSTGTLPANNWSHVIYKYDSILNKEYFYINGKYDSEHTPSSTPVWNNNFKIGQYDVVNYKYHGLIDDVKIYNYALSSDEVKTDYNSSTSVKVGTSSQTIGATTTSLDYCVPGDTTACLPPIAEWRFDEGLGTTAFDTSGNGNNGIFGPIYFSPIWTVGKFGKAGNFASGNYVDVPTASSLNITGALTVEAWVKKGNTTQTTRHILIKGGRVRDVTNNYNLWNDSINRINFTVADGNNYFEVNGSALNDTNWHHYAGVYTPSTSLKLYVDGALQATNSTNIPAALTTNSNSLTIGANSGHSEYWVGQIDQVRIFNYARTPAQITYDYNRGGPVGWWKLDECQGGVAFDASGLGNTGAISIGASGTQNTLGTCSIGTSAAWTNGAVGKINSSLNFDGNDDYVDCGKNVSLDITSAITLSVWLKDLDVSKNPGVIGKYPNYLMQIWQNKFIFQTGAVWKSSNTSLINGTMYHLVATYDGINARFYLNGIPDGIQAMTTAMVPTANDFLIGKYFGETDAFPGQIDDVRVYNYALTATQVKTLYNGGAVNFQ